MLDRIIKFSLNNRLFVIAASIIIMVYGIFTFISLPVDVLPDLNRPRVTIFLETGGMAPEEIETSVVLPVETALNGAPGVEVIRSSSTLGIGMVFVEFDWDTDVYLARQIVSEKLQTVQLPDNIKAVMGPISSVMGQIMLIGLTSDSTSAVDLRTLADFTVRRRLMSIKGVSQIIPIGGERKQYQVLINSSKLKQYNLVIDDIDAALNWTNKNTTGGFFDQHGSEVLIRNIARVNDLKDLQNTVVTNRNGFPVMLSQVADIKMGTAQKRGDASVNGKPAVILTVEKQPGASTVTLTNEIENAIQDLQKSLPSDIKLNTKVFQQKNFIVNSLTNVEEALRDGFILVAIILFMFLLNARTTIITLTAIPLSLILTAIIFKLFGFSINTLTLGGLAIAIGELVDDAIVDVENVYRRLKQNFKSTTPKPIVQVVYEASSEVRNSIVYATIIVVLVFLPLFYLEGIEGRIFSPLGVAYITSIIASLLVSLTLTPTLCSYLLGNEKALRHIDLMCWKKGRGQVENKDILDDSSLVKWLKKIDEKQLGWALKNTDLIIIVASILILVSITMVPFFGREFLPAFNEKSFTINLATPPGTSLEESNKIGTIAEKLILKIPEVDYVSRRTGRAELDEHVEPVSNSEIDVALKETINRSRNEIIADIRSKLGIMKGIDIEVGQPISHRLDHLLTGVRAQVAMKLVGDDLLLLRQNATKIKEIVSAIPGTVDVKVERQVLVPQLQIKLNREALIRYGIQPGKVVEDLEIFYNGKVESQVIEDNKLFDILLRANSEDRNNLDNIRNTLIHSIDGKLIPLQQIATIEMTNAINTISHENSQRRIFISCNVQGRDLGSTVEDIKKYVSEKIDLPQGYYLTYGGQYESQQAASQKILYLALFAFTGIFLVLYSHFRSIALALQIMLNIPLALIGSVIAVLLSGGVFSVATMVGFITLTGIASRNGIMLISHYIYLVEHEEESFDDKMIIRGSLERLVPVLMTALVAALALIPLALDAEAAGKEILHPVAVVILGGLISSTLLDMVVTPVVFKVFGKKALEQYFSEKHKIQ